MSFFLLGKRAEGTLYLLSDSTFESRADAMRELGRLTADAAFGGWDDEIVVVDDAHGAPVLLVRPAAAPAVEPSVHADPTPLKAAIERSAARMEAEGISAPESVGMPEEDAPADEVPVADEVQEESAAESTSTDVCADGDATAVEAPAAWPWDDGPLSGLEEAGSDEDSLVKAAGDDDTFSVARPVILGAYGEAQSPTDDTDVVAAESDGETTGDGGAPLQADTASGTEDEAEPVGDLVSSADDAAPTDETAPVREDEAPPVEAEAREGSETSQPVEEDPSPEFVIEASAQHETPAPVSDFVDLTSADVPESRVAEPQAEQPAVEDPRPIESMTCDDCVYVETCPNHGQRMPSSCGSFQWK